MSMSMTTDRSHRSCLYFLYDLRVIEKRHVNYFTLLLNALAIVVEVIVGEQLHGDSELWIFDSLSFNFEKQNFECMRINIRVLIC